VCSEE
jgi:hypothetical protein